MCVIDQTDARKLMCAESPATFCVSERAVEGMEEICNVCIWSQAGLKNDIIYL